MAENNCKFISPFQKYNIASESLSTRSPSRLLEMHESKKGEVNSECSGCRRDGSAPTQLQRLPIKNYAGKRNKAGTKHSKGIKNKPCVVFHMERPSTFTGNEGICIASYACEVKKDQQRCSQHIFP